MNSARLRLAISAPTDGEISPPWEYQSSAAATRISFANSVGDKRSAKSPPSGASNTIVGIVRAVTNQDTAAAAGERIGLVCTLNRAPKRPVRFYRLSAVCQPTVEILVAGAGFEPATFGL
jgi:hypothetical protein